MQNQLQDITQKVLQDINASTTTEALRDIEVSILGKKGKLTSLLKNMKDLCIEEKKTFGPLANDAKNTLQKAIQDKRMLLEREEENKRLESEWCDHTYSKKHIPLGSLHPITQLQRELEEVFMNMGFTVKDGPELDSEWRNFDSLNIPNTHPARDMQDTFFVDLPEDDTEGKWVMRTHTSNLQNRVYKELKAPCRVFMPGKVYRYEAIDATHDMTFHQCEGVVVGEDITLGHLKYTIEKALSQVLHQKIKTRFRPGYFPFVEPGLELDIWDTHRNTWMEFMGCGMIHPKVLEHGDIDSKMYNGFAFGFGLTRLCMIRYGITDIREFFSGDQRFVEQF